jgi:tRNA 2-thiouridine synthesizing protein D
MNFAIAVYGAPYSSQAAYSAYRFVKTAITQGHRVERVFFYHDGVYNGTSLSVPPRDELDLCGQWRMLKKDHGVDLVLCIAAALKRGLLDPGEARRHDKDNSAVAEEFELSGLGQLVEAAALADRFITFGH